MLYDKRWEKPEIKADPFTLEGLIAWLEKKPAAQKYDWSLAGSCLLGQWCESNGLHGAELFNKSLELGRWSSGNEVFAEVALGDTSECTFGAALKRARALR